MSIQKINVGGQDVEIEDTTARTSITSLNTRVTTLENNSSGGGGSGVGDSTEIKTYNFKLYNLTGELMEDYEVKCINKTSFLDVYFMFMLGSLDYSNIDNNRIKIGTCTMTDTNNNKINTKSAIPIVYQFRNSEGNYTNNIHNGNLIFSYDETNVGTNIVELIINKEDVQMIKNIDKNNSVIEFVGGGLFNDNIYIP